MTSTNGSKLKLHHRHNLGPDKESIRFRYATYRRKLSQQVSLLQKSDVFRAKCTELYERGYKDWMILGALLNWTIRIAGSNASEIEATMQQTNERIRSDEPFDEQITPDDLCGDEFLGFLYSFNFLFLATTYGFDLNRRKVEPRAAERFLSERLAHFDRDIPHVPMFGEKPGDWPSKTEKV